MVTIGIYIVDKRVQHPVVRSFDTTGVAGADGDWLLQLAQRRRCIAYIGGRERIEIGLTGHRVSTHPISSAVGVFATQTQFHRPMLAKLLTDRYIGRSHMLVIAELRRRSADRIAVADRIGKHVVVCRRQCIFDAAFNHTCFPELGLEIQLGTIYVCHLVGVDVQPEFVDANVVRLLEVMGGCLVAVIVHVNG